MFESALATGAGSGFHRSSVLSRIHCDPKRQYLSPLEARAGNLEAIRMESECGCITHLAALSEERSSFVAGGRSYFVRTVSRATRDDNLSQRFLSIRAGTRFADRAAKCESETKYLTLWQITGRMLACRVQQSR